MGGQQVFQETKCQINTEMIQMTYSFNPVLLVNLLLLQRFQPKPMMDCKAASLGLLRVYSVFCFKKRSDLMQEMTIVVLKLC